MHDIDTDYRDIVSEWFTESMSITFSHGISIDEVATAFGDLDTGRYYTYPEAVEESYEAFEAAGIGCAAIVGELGEWVVTVEPDGYKGNLWHVLQRLSQFDRAISVLCGHGTYNLSYVVRSQMVADLRLWDYSRRSAIESSELDPYVDGLEFTENDLLVKASVLAVCARMTGERLDSDWLNRRHRWLLWEDPD
ncbi:DUF6461 domain-containing protein [Nonomuraea sp. KM88]|uniref:DUF6461 domain-containing protein n=1 Tax=Nonomuraea sp. KM88 TaxID=3457427 RepID=UPI003FCD216A